MEDRYLFKAKRVDNGEYKDYERRIQVYSQDGVMMYDEKFFK